ncbi:MAG: bifunctional phosphopantothenoylcysteine decarboxylase/phosphopantothenate--cysteine ligase CoaBC [Thermaerobacter sp.]|nr:bifunctional phosphopantothenoylcysteine decarboxylase/phosphopantothenate--cysteine ligase CoaBC [Thermaerobacter sp.]
MSRIVLGVTGGVAAYKAVMLASRLRQSGHDVDVVLTPAAEAFVTGLSFSSVSGRRAYTNSDLFSAEGQIVHVELAHAADLVVVAPASADFLAKAAHGIADGLLATILLATPAKVLLAPAMEAEMWGNPATQRAVAQLRTDGRIVLEPESGHLASGRSGIGRMPAPEVIEQWILRTLRPPVLAGLRVLVTGGPTREYIDPVRFISNPSTGRMGIAVAEAARDAGADVTLVIGPTELAAAPGIQKVEVTSAAEMLDAVKTRFSEADAFIATAAVADLRPEARSLAKVKKADLQMQLAMERTVDILAWAGSVRQQRQVLVGFAAETGNLAAEARRKLHEKHCDLVVGNDVGEPGAGFAAETNRCLFVTADGERQVGPASKREVGEEIIAFVADRLRQR